VHKWVSSYLRAPAASASAIALFKQSFELALDLFAEKRGDEYLKAIQKLL